MFLVLSFSFHAWSKQKIPYSIDGEIVFEADLQGNQKTLELSFCNLTDKVVSSFTVVFYLFDEEGNSVLVNKNSLVFKFEERVLAGESLDVFKRLDSFIFDTENEYYEMEYLYVSIIEYEDGFVWKDPFGLKCF